MPHPSKGYAVNGVKVPGVTTIIGRFKDSGGLLFWAFEQGKAAERGEISKLYDKRDEAAEAGTLAHSLVEARIHGQSLPDFSTIAPDITKQAMQGLENYDHWQIDNRIENLMLCKNLAEHRWLHTKKNTALFKQTPLYLKKI